MSHHFIDSTRATPATVRLAVAGLGFAMLAIVGPGRAAAIVSTARSPGEQVFVRGAASHLSVAGHAWAARVAWAAMRHARLVR